MEGNASIKSILCILMFTRVCSGYGKNTTCAGGGGGGRFELEKSVLGFIFLLKIFS